MGKRKPAADRPKPRLRGVTMRAARGYDMDPCARVFIHAINDLVRRFGGRPTPRHAKQIAKRLNHLRMTDPRGFQVALKGGRVIAFASTILREDVHFLSMFWALPSMQQRGVGRPLLARAFNEPDPPATAVRCVYASLDPRAQALYLSLGMVPRSMVYFLTKEGPARQTPAPERAVELVQLGEPGEIAPDALALAAAVDRKVRGARRDADIAFTMSDPKARFFEAREGSDPVGYLIIQPDGLMGMGGVIDPSFTEGLTWAGMEAVRALGLKKTSLQVLGLNDGALRVAMRGGLRTSAPNGWMAQREFGKLDCYFATLGDIF